MAQSDQDANRLWQAFSALRLAEGNLNDRLDLPNVLSLVPPGQNARALDLGCGLGQASFQLAERLGYQVTAVDNNELLLSQARKLYRGAKIEWVFSDFDVLPFAPGTFKVIISCLAFHFIRNLDDVISSCAKWLETGGRLIFSVRHPIRTSDPVGELHGETNVSWIVSNYSAEGLREFHWLEHPCVNYHRTFSTYLQMLRSSGLQIENVRESSVHDQHDAIAMESRSVPFFLTISAKRE